MTNNICERLCVNVLRGMLRPHIIQGHAELEMKVGESEGS
jgi:hypothetical protein